jgi:osmotically-inducible protein OsmY
MSVYLHDENLRVRIIRSIQNWKWSLARDIVVTALADGTVFLRGMVSQGEDYTDLEELVNHVSGVTCVFCNVAVKS